MCIVAAEMGSSGADNYVQGRAKMIEGKRDERQGRLHVLAQSKVKLFLIC